LYWQGVVYASADGVNWTKVLEAPNHTKLNAIATNGVGTIVAGGGSDGNYTVATYIYTSTGGMSWVRTAWGYYNKYTGDITGFYIGIVYSVYYSGMEGRFKAGDWYKSKAYSVDGYKWYKY
jgi:hypothetical protein